MGDKTDNLEKAFEYVRTFYNETARMFSDIIEFMSKAGWEAPTGGITDGLSYTLDYPDKWMVYYTYKNFTNPAVSDHVKGILFFFNTYMNKFPISLVCGKLNESPNSSDRWGIYCLALDNKEKLRDLNGRVIKLTTLREGKTLEGDLFAIPLSEIESAQDVKEKIVQRLIEL
jgi:hypothetical protein